MTDRLELYAPLLRRERVAKIASRADVLARAWGKKDAEWIARMRPEVDPFEPLARLVRDHEGPLIEYAARRVALAALVDQMPPDERPEAALRWEPARSMLASYGRPPIGADRERIAAMGRERYGELKDEPDRIAAEVRRHAAAYPPDMEREVEEWSRKYWRPAAYAVAVDRVERERELEVRSFERPPPWEASRGRPPVVLEDGVDEQVERMAGEKQAALRALSTEELKVRSDTFAAALPDRHAALAARAHELRRERAEAEMVRERFLARAVDLEAKAASPDTSRSRSSRLSHTADYLRHEVREARAVERSIQDLRREWVDLYAEKEALRREVTRSIEPDPAVPDVVEHFEQRTMLHKYREDVRQHREAFRDRWATEPLDELRLRAAELGDPLDRLDPQAARWAIAQAHQNQVIGAEHPQRFVAREGAALGEALALADVLRDRGYGGHERERAREEPELAGAVEPEQAMGGSRSGMEV